MTLVSRTAAIVTVGSELVHGLRVDTNTAEIARALKPCGFSVVEAVSVGDDVEVLTQVLARLTSQCELVITTGGLGPTHDDITREAAAAALGVELSSDPRIVEALRDIQTRHSDERAREQVLRQADVLPGARVIDATTGSAPGQIVDTPAGTLALLPGPPSEMRPMLTAVLEPYHATRAQTRELGIVGSSESDAQVVVSHIVDGVEGIGFTVLAKPGDVRIILTDEGAGETVLDELAGRVADELGIRCYATDGSSLAQTVVRLASQSGVKLVTAESCTGGLVAAALTDVPGSSDVFLGSVVAYANQAKMDLLGVPAGMLAQYGAVSEQTVAAMATGALDAFTGATIAVSISGIAGPGGGTADKPVGTVWFGVAHAQGTLVSDDAGSQHQFVRHMRGASREAVRARATALALDCLRRAIVGLKLPE